MIKFSQEFKLGGSDIFLNCCTGIEDFYSLLSGIHTSKVVNYPMLVTMTENPYQVLGDFFKFIHAQYVGKFQELTKGYIESINQKNYLVAALCGRSIIESTATLRYYNKECKRKIRFSAENHRPDNDEFDLKMINSVLQILEQHMRGSRFDWSKFFTSDKKTFVHELVEKAKSQNKSQEFPESLPIIRLLESWSKDAPELRLFYDFFSDLVHPNFGSNLLLMGVSENTTQIGGDTNKSIGKKICAESVMLLTPCIKEASLQLGESVLLSCLGDPLESN